MKANWLPNTWYFNHYPFVLFNDDKSVDGRGPDYAMNHAGSYTFITYEQFISLDLKKSGVVYIKLNDEYSAAVYKDRIEVGCQTFDINLLEKLNKAHASLTK